MPMLISLSLVFSLAMPQEPTPPAPSPSPPPAPGPAGAAMGWTGVLDEKEFAALHTLTGAKAPPLRGEFVEVGGARDYLSLPQQGKPPFPAVLVIHEFWGLNDHIEHWADRLAADGYAALAVDLYGGKVAKTSDEAVAMMRAVGEAPDPARKVLHAAFAFLAASPRIQAQKRGCIGWCFGGGWSLQVALAEPELDAAVIYYGRLVTDVDQLRKIHAPLLGIFGNRDRGIPPAAVDAFAQAMQKAGRDCRILRYDAEHAFANPSGARYDEANAAKAWAEVRAFLKRSLAGGKPAPPPAKGDGGR